MLRFGSALAVSLALASCSYVAVHAPASTDVKGAHCTDDDIVPMFDSIVGVLGVAGALGGEIANHLSSHPIAHYELLIGLPALAVGIVYLVSASSGTDKVERCQAAKQAQIRGCDGCPAGVP
jgi:hypothetical protein